VDELGRGAIEQSGRWLSAHAGMGYGSKGFGASPSEVEAWKRGRKLKLIPAGASSRLKLPLGSGSLSAR